MLFELPLPNFFLGFSAIFFGYILQSSLLEYFFYCKRRNRSWKIQQNAGDPHCAFYFLPIFSSKKNRGPYHKQFTFINIILGGFSAGLIAELVHRGVCPMSFSPVDSLSSVIRILRDFGIAFLSEAVLEYYWHRLMHTKYFYAIAHKYHHHYKSPEVWDDMYIFPLEAIGYYFILYSPPFLYHTHVYAFLLYMGCMGLCGVLDHSGIRVKLPLHLYNTEDHDLHHLKFNVNFGFPVPWLDILHGSYEGTYLGIKFHPTGSFAKVVSSSSHACSAKPDD
jgi:sterol desaturase/sphingolipid hydroxylase (fatty acid hydroxylase superfamily)